MFKTQSATSKLSANPITISDTQRQGRAINAVAELLMRKLLVPKVFIEPKGIKVYVKPKLAPNLLPFADVVAIDRAGSGDVYAVEVLPPQFSEEALKKFWPMLEKRIFKFQPVHFFYIAVASDLIDFVSRQQLFANDGIGRIGIIEVKENASAPLEAKIAIPAERFRVDPDWLKTFNDFQEKNPADMEFRG